MVRRLLKASALLTIGQGLGQISALGRNAIIARLISVAHMGIGRSFGLTATLLEMATYLAPESLMIQAKDGDTPRLQHVAHFIQAMRGLIMGLLVFAVAKPVTMIFEIPEALWAFQLLAVIPVIEGFIHLDMKRLQRDYNYTPAVIAESGSQIVMLVLAWPLAIWLRDYSVVLWLLMVKAVFQVTASHILAQRPYRVSMDREYLSRFFHFGWPLLVNGLLICLIRQGDHIILGAYFGMAALGVYANAYLLTMLPTKMLANIGRSLTLPLLSSTRDDNALYEERYRLTVQVVSLLGLCLGVSFVLLGGRLAGLVFGEEYRAASAYIGWLAGLATLRLIRTAPTQAAMARADTRNSMIANFASSVGLLGMFIGVQLGKPIAWIAFSAFIGELCAVGASVIRLRVKQGVAVSVSVLAGTVPALGLLSAATAVHFGLDSGWMPAIGWAAIIVLSHALPGAWLLGLTPDILNRTVRRTSIEGPSPEAKPPATEGANKR